MTDITTWLARHNIHQSDILTSWWMINYTGHGEGVNFIPGGFNVSPENKDTAHWYVEHPRFLISWPMIYVAYQKGACKYVITSGLGERAHIGQDDPFLKEVKPVMAWPHPYTIFRDRPFYRREDLSIKLYALADIFSPENIRRATSK